MSGWRRGAEVNTESCAHPHERTYVRSRALEPGSMRTHTRHVALTQLHAVFERRFNHGDTHLGAAARWRWPSLGARRDEQSEH